MCLDADTEDVWAGLRQLAQNLADNDIPAYPEASRRGGHLWVFTPRLPGITLRQFGRALLQRGELPENIEVFPKQDRLTTGPGSLVRLPLGVHRKSGQRYPLLTPEDQPLGLETLLAGIRRVPPDFITETCARVRPLEPAPPVPARFERRPAQGGTPLSEQIKQSISVYDFVSRYVALDERGVGKCPFHDDHHPSFQVNVEGNYWSCYAGCGGGSLIDFAMRWRDLHGEDGSFPATVRALRALLLT